MGIYYHHFLTFIRLAGSNMTTSDAFWEFTARDSFLDTELFDCCSMTISNAFWDVSDWVRQPELELTIQIKLHSGFCLM